MLPVLPVLLNTNRVCVQADAAVLHATRGLQEIIAGQEEQIQRLKHAAANSRPAVQQISQAFKQIHAMSIQHNVDGCSIVALSREVKFLLDHKIYILGSW